MKQFIKAITMFLILLAIFSSCSLFGPSDEQIQAAFEALVRGITAGAAGTITYSTNATGGYDYTITGSGVTMTYSVTTQTATEYTATITFDNYVDSTSGYTISGSISHVITSSTATVSGDLTYTGGVVKTVTCDYVLDIKAGSVTGTFTANGRVLDLASN